MSKIPPGQRYIDSWPVRTAEEFPSLAVDEWTLEVSGLVQERKVFTLDEIWAFPQVEIEGDFHCVETWSVPNNRWKGVRVKEILDRVSPLKEARFAVFHSPGGYSSEVDMVCARDEGSLLAWERNGEPIPFEHGYPLRLIIPGRYAYKSVKWVCKIELVDEDIRGYWEARGYHPVADVWKNERYG